MSLFDGCVFYYQNGVDLCGSTMTNTSAILSQPDRFGLPLSSTFNGSAYVSSSNILQTVGSGDFYYTVWAKRSGNNGIRNTIMGALTSNGTSPMYYIELDAAGYPWVYLSYSTNGYIQVTHQTAITDTNWHCLEVYRKNDYCYINLDGVVCNSPASCSGITFVSPPTPISIGRGGQYPNLTFFGSVGEAVIIVGTSNLKYSFYNLTKSKYIYPLQRGERNNNDS